MDIKDYGAKGDAEGPIILNDSMSLIGQENGMFTLIIRDLTQQNIKDITDFMNTNRN